MGLGLSLLSSFRISGLGSPFGLVLRTWAFRWAGLFLGPGEWACEPYFLNSIRKYIKTIILMCYVKMRVAFKIS